MEHYFSADPQSGHKPATVAFAYRGHAVTLDTDSGVFSRTELDRGTWELLCALPDSLSGALLDMGCGYGAIGVAAGLCWPELSVTMADVNSRACELAERNARRNGVQARVCQSDGYAALADERYQWILQNPPIRAGKAVIYRMLADGARHLAPGGELWLVIRKQQGAPSAMAYLKTLFATVECAAKKGGFWVIRCFDPLLQQEGSEP